MRSVLPRLPRTFTIFVEIMSDKLCQIKEIMSDKAILDHKKTYFVYIGSFRNAFEDIRLLPNKISLNIKINNYY